MLVQILPLTEETEFYQLSAFPGALEQFAEDLAEWVFWASIYFEMDELADLDVAAMWEESRMPGLTGIALRSDRSDEHPRRFTNETALVFSGQPQGFFSILTQEPVVDPLAGQLPGDALLAVSLSVDLTDLFQATWNMLRAANARQLMRTWSEMQEIGPLAHLGPEFDFLPQLGQLFFSGPIRCDLAFRPAPEGGTTSLGFPFEEVAIPKWEAYLRFDSPGIAYHAYEAEDLLKHILGEEGFTRWAHPIEGRPVAWRIDLSDSHDEPTGGALEIVEVDFTAGSVQLWTSKVFHAEMASSGRPRLAENPAYGRAIGDAAAPVQLYAAPVFLGAFDEFFQMVFSADSPGFPQLSGLQRYFHSLLGSGEPYAWSLRREGNVIRHHAYSPASHKNKTVLAYLALPAAFATAVIEAIENTRTVAIHTQQVSQMRQISMAMHTIMLDRGRPPASLDEVWDFLGEKRTPVMGGAFPEFSQDFNSNWVYTYTAPDGTRFHFNHRGNVWME